MSMYEILTYWGDHNNISAAPTVTSFSDSGLNIERYDYGGGDGDVAMTHYKILGGWHLWFSFSDEGANTDRLIWDFVSRFDVNGAR